ncbi:homoserine O-acetyltransferase [Pseudorhodoferax aquiterrae]|uniref:Homoserine O-acetyltransferase n=1 Tax=Pseudorhodoferax aquiterrae TaxID=747304 RepID=A0ABQ3GD00_9BURK|nr:alpha/beta fold hydrolase [Pseudorhodoferax aquiterrae]GHD01322.1 homoserine O-acetyltransferase [Pseudorhodoferax aquiterrae]
MRIPLLGAALALPMVFAGAAGAADYPAPQKKEWVLNDFRFHTGEVLPQLRLAYTTVGDPQGEPVVVLHGTAGSGERMLTPAFAGELFGPGQPLDARKYYIILPDAIGAGASSKPSDGLRMAFPRYNYEDMVQAQYRLVREHLGLGHVRLVLGNSMGGMQAWMWAQKYPGYMDIAVPMASVPAAMSGRNWMMRRLLVESIQRDPAWANGNYTAQPPGLGFALAYFGLATSGGTQKLQNDAPTRTQADALVDRQLAASAVGDANDHIYQWDASRDYDASGQLERIEATVLAINSADDERNPPELGLLEQGMRRVRNGRILLVPASAQTSGHGTTGQARWWKDGLAEVLRSVPPGAAR